MDSHDRHSGPPGYPPTGAYHLQKPCPRIVFLPLSAESDPRESFE
jgi:hypothetical protein